MGMGRALVVLLAVFAVVEAEELGRRGGAFLLSGGSFTLSSGSNTAGNDEALLGEGLVEDLDADSALTTLDAANDVSVASKKAQERATKKAATAVKKANKAAEEVGEKATTTAPCPPPTPCTDKERAQITVPVYKTCGAKCLMCMGQKGNGSYKGCMDDGKALKDTKIPISWAKKTGDFYDSQLLVAMGVDMTEKEKGKKVVVTFATSRCKAFGTKGCEKYCCKSKKIRKCYSRGGAEVIFELGLFKEQACNTDPSFIAAGASS